MADYIPKKDSELVSWCANFTAEVVVNAEEWEIPQAEVSRLQNAGDKFAALYAQADSPTCNSVIIAEKNTARKALVKEIRSLADFRLKNPVISDGQRIGLGLHVRQTTHTPVPPPASRPELDIDVLDFRRLKISFRDFGSNTRAKPQGVTGAVILYSVLDSPPEDITALSNSLLATRTPRILNFSESERGKTVYVAVCWQNGKGEQGAWSDIESAIIP